MANSVDPGQTAPIGAVCSGFMLFASILNLSVMLGNYLQQITSADDIFRCIFVLGALRVRLETQAFPCADPEGGQGVRIPALKISKLYFGFLSNTSQDPLKFHKATKPAFNFGPSSTCQ